MATSTIKRGQIALHKGENSLGRFIAGGYVTGSGNYFDFLVPISNPDNLTISSITYDAPSAKVIGNGNAAQITAISAVNVYEHYIILEATLTSTNSPNTSQTFISNSLKIICS